MSPVLHKSTFKTTPSKGSIAETMTDGWQFGFARGGEAVGGFKEEHMPTASQSLLHKSNSWRMGGLRDLFGSAACVLQVLKIWRRARTWWGSPVPPCCCCCCSCCPSCKGVPAVRPRSLGRGVASRRFCFCGWVKKKKNTGQNLLMEKTMSEM